MPRGLTATDQKLLLGALVVALLLIALTITLSPERNDGGPPTTYSAGSGGAKAAYLLLSRLRYPVTRWERPLGELSRDGHATLIIADPPAAPTVEEQQAIEQFLNEGGRVIVTGFGGAFFVPHHAAARDEVAGLTWKPLSSRSPSAITRAAPEITLAPQASWSADSAIALYGDNKVRVVKYLVGKGDVIWWASATPLTNAGLTEPGNLEFFLACLGDPTRAIMWDEYVHGHRALTVQEGSPFGWLPLPVALGLVAALLTYSRRSGPIVPAVPESRLAPIEFVRTLGSLYGRAGAAGIAVDIAYQRFRYRLMQRLGITGAATIDDLQGAVSDRSSLNDAALGDLLRTCEDARTRSRLPARDALKLTRALHDYAMKLDLLSTRTKGAPSWKP